MRQQKQDCLYELQMLPLVMEKNSLKSKRQLIEERLLEAEAGIKLFTRKKVYIPIDSENSISR